MIKHLEEFGYDIWVDFSKLSAIGPIETSEDINDKSKKTYELSVIIDGNFKIFSVLADDGAMERIKKMRDFFIERIKENGPSE